ncbi:MAG: cupin, partial [Rhodospirillaceae bacterium]|nr:cupin [Rhodospirillaceae bacterium]
PEGMEQKVLTSDLDEAGKTGSRSRFLRIKPGVYSTEPFVHEHWEEVYLCEGDMIVGNDENGEGGEKFQAPTYACRPPGVFHGPFKSEGGCVMFELHYFYKADAE